MVPTGTVGSLYLYNIGTDPVIDTYSLTCNHTVSFILQFLQNRFLCVFCSILESCRYRYFQKQLNAKFDVILIEPPLEEYSRSYGVTNTKFWDWDKATR